MAVASYWKISKILSFFRGSSYRKGGIYRDFEPGQMVLFFDKASFTSPVGEVGDIVETQYGYHILKVIERKKEERPFEEVKEELLKFGYEKFGVYDIKSPKPPL